MTRSKHVELIAGIGNGYTYSQSITIFNPAKIITIFIPIMYTVAYLSLYIGVLHSKVK